MKFIHILQSRGILLNEFKLEVVGVIADKTCGATNYAFENGIPCQIHSFDRVETEDRTLIRLIEGFKADFIITNVHKILSSRIVARFEGQLVNLHYSLLPAFKGTIGMKALESYRDLNCSFFGTTCHLVDQQVDNGRILAQSVTVMAESPNPIEDTFRTGCLTLINGIIFLSGGRTLTSYQLDHSLLSPSVDFSSIPVDQFFNELNSI